MGVEGVLRRHAPAHDGVQEGLPLPGVEPQNLEHREQEGGRVTLDTAKQETQHCGSDGDGDEEEEEEDCDGDEDDCDEEEENDDVWKSASLQVEDFTCTIAYLVT